MNAKSYKFAEHLGHGGIRCSCCTKGVPAVSKKLINRKFRKTAKKAVREGLS